MDGLLSLVIPVFNEADSLAPLVAEIDEALAAYGSPYEIVFVDDGSTDGSFAVMKELAGARDDVRVVKLRRNFGKAAALSHGFAAARGDCIVTMDGDRQDDPAERSRLRLEAAAAGPAQQDAAVQVLQLDRPQGVRDPAARLQLRAQGLQA
jgi:glycosyltransferase involved in cell wall biosynthesis